MPTRIGRVKSGEPCHVNCLASWDLLDKAEGATALTVVESCSGFRSNPTARERKCQRKDRSSS